MQSLTSKVRNGLILAAVTSAEASRGSSRTTVAARVKPHGLGVDRD
jgi:hypothetical protein